MVLVLVENQSNTSGIRVSIQNDNNESELIDYDQLEENDFYNPEYFEDGDAAWYGCKGFDIQTQILCPDNQASKGVAIGVKGRKPTNPNLDYNNHWKCKKHFIIDDECVSKM